MQRPLSSAKRRYGFTLIELMMVVAIIAVLGAIALPAYNRYVQKSRRTDAHNMLMRLAAEQERYYTLFNRYTADLSGAPPAGLGMASTTSEHGYYTIAGAIGAGGQTFTLTATPAAIQAVDKCGNLTLSSADAKGFSGDQTNGVCW